MKNLYFDNFEDFACAVADTYDTLDYDDEEDVVVIAKYEEAKHIIKELLCLGYDIHSLEIHDDLWNKYDAEYVVSLYENEVWCEPMLREKGYIDENAPFIYVMGNCSSKIIPHCKGKTVYEVTVGEEECDFDDECDEGFTVDGKPVSKEEFDACVSKLTKIDKKSSVTSNATYKINGKLVSKEEFDKKYEEFEEIYLDNIRDMILNYCSFMDEVNELRSRLFRW